MRRRDFVGGISAATALSLTRTSASAGKDEWIDCNITLGHWPFRQLDSENAQRFAASLIERGVTQALAASFEGIFHRDVRAENSRLARLCSENGSTFFVPVATINPMLPDWREDLRQSQEEHAISVIRLYPNYHGYSLEDTCFGELLALATERKMRIQIVVQIEDDRTQPDRLQVPPVDLRHLPGQLDSVTNARVMILNAMRSQLSPILGYPKILFDLGKLDGIGTLDQVLALTTHEQIVFGSHAPFFYWEAARLKLQESELLDRQLNAILHDNAVQWLRG